MPRAAMDGGAEVAESLNEWEQIQSPPAHVLSSSAQSKEWEMVVIKDNYLHNDCSVFPPSHHEGLQITAQKNQVHEEEKPNFSSSLSEEPSQSEEQLRVRGEIGRSLRLRFEFLSSGIFRLASNVRCFVGFSGGFRSLASVSGVGAALLLSVLYVRVQRWRRRLREENQNRLILLVKEKNEKISQLLLQIGQMNELLSTRRRVPVLRIN